MGGQAILGVSNLSAGYGKTQILYELSMSVMRGQLTLVVGPNGSGKSTLAKAIFNLASIFSGDVFFKERNVTKLTPEEKIIIGMRMVPQLSNVFENLTVRENLETIYFAIKYPKKNFEDSLEYVFSIFPILRDKQYEKVRTLSGGERQMVALARALVAKPELIIFDEPTAMLSPALSNLILNKIREINESGVAVLLIEQNVKTALRISDYVYVLVSGRKVLEGVSERFINNFSMLEDAFFGKSPGSEFR